MNPDILKEAGIITIQPDMKRNYRTTFFEEKSMKKKAFWAIIFFLTLFLPVLSSGAEDKCLKGDCLNGKGVMEYADGKQYSGEFLGGIRQGQGTYIFPNGEKYTGGFDKGEPNGKARPEWSERCRSPTIALAVKHQAVGKDV